MANEGHPITTTDAEITAAIARGEHAPAPYAQKVWYDARRDAIVARIVSPGLVGPLDVPFARQRMQGLQRATPDELSRMELEGDGTGIVWPALDVAHYIPGLLAGVFGTARWMAALNGRRGGQNRSLAKAMAARANGAKGGRPPTRQRRAASRRAGTRSYNKPIKKSPVGKRRQRTRTEQPRKPEGSS